MPRLARTLAHGSLILIVLAWSIAPIATPFVQPARAEEIDCEDQDNFNDPDCVLERQRNTPPPPSEGPAEDQAPPEPPAPPVTDPRQIVFAMEDAGKEATQYLNQEGTDDRGRWVRTRFERDRSSGASQLGPNVIDTKAWVAKDLESAKALFKQQADIKNFPERVDKERVTGPNERFKFDKVGEESSAMSAYYEDGDGLIWHHVRIVIRKGSNVAVMYLFGRSESRTPEKDIMTNDLIGWFGRKLADRM